MAVGKAGSRQGYLPPRISPAIYNRDKKIGWGGRIRTFTVLINSEVSYQLDHAPAASLAALPGARKERHRPMQGRLRHIRRDEGYVLR